jgi:hypothetical protein
VFPKVIDWDCVLAGGLASAVVLLGVLRVLDALVRLS